MSKLQQAIFCLLVSCLFPLTAQGQVANVLSSVGAANRGAATAMPLDASNSQDWNPGSITDLPVTELDLNVQPSLPHINLDASLPSLPTGTRIQPTAGAHIGGGVGDGNRFNITPALGFVKKIKESRWTVGILSAAPLGSGVEYSGSKNPLTSPRVGGGKIKVSGDLIYIAPTVAYRLTERLSVGIQPNLTISSFQASPFPAEEPDDANGDGIPTFPKTNRAWARGFGINGGAYYRYKDIRVGATLKSPIWFTPYHFQSKDELGQPHNFKKQFNAPMILSMGWGYSGIPRTKLAMDVRWVNYANTRGFEDVGFTPQGAVKGLGWRNIWAWVGSAQYDVTKKCSLRVAYGYNLNPIIPKYTSFSIASPALVQHQMSVALSYRIRHNIVLAAAYLHGFANSSEGPINRPVGPIPGSSVKITSSLDSIAATLVFLFK